MKTRVLLGSLLLAVAMPSHAQPPAKRPKAQAAEPNQRGYISESPLPKGWPEPGPFNEVCLKAYPAYRAAIAMGDRPNGEFMTLFRHIKRHDIPMTAPVEMTLDADAKDTAAMKQMAFLYQDTSVGKTGADGEEVEVRDMPATKALSYAWQGPRSMAAKAREAIDAELQKRGLKATGYRLLGYNSPFIPRSKQTHELQALIQE